MCTLTCPALEMHFDDRGKLIFFGAPEGENRLNAPVDFVILSENGQLHTPVGLTDSEGYLCFTFADETLFYLLPETADCGIALDTAGFFPSTALTDRVEDDLTALSVTFGLPEGIPGAVGMEVWSATPTLCAAATAQEGFMGVKLALGAGDAMELVAAFV